MSPMPKKQITEADVAAKKTKLEKAEAELAILESDKLKEREKLFHLIATRVAKFALGCTPRKRFQVNKNGDKILVNDMDATWSSRRPVIRIAKMIKDHYPDADIMAELIEFLIAETDRKQTSSRQWNEVKEQWAQRKKERAARKKQS